MHKTMIFSVWNHVASPISRMPPHNPEPNENLLHLLQLTAFHHPCSNVTVTIHTPNKWTLDLKKILCINPSRAPCFDTSYYTVHTLPLLSRSPRPFSRLNNFSSRSGDHYFAVLHFYHLPTYLLSPIHVLNRGDHCILFWLSEIIYFWDKTIQCRLNDH